jgi:hypothetical protein
MMGFGNKKTKIKENPKPWNVSKVNTPSSK